MVLEQAALTHDIERIFRSKKSEKNFSKRRRRQAAHGSIDITSSLDICDGVLIPRRLQGRACTTAEQLGRVRRVKVRPGEGVIALPYEPS